MNEELGFFNLPIDEGAAFVYNLQFSPLKLEIVDKGSSLIDRKIKEAKFLVHNKPSLNDIESELNNLTQFLVA